MINRFRFVSHYDAPEEPEYKGGAMLPSRSGSWVRYEDHEKAIKEINSQIGAIVSSLKDNPHGWIMHGQMLQELYRKLGGS